MKYLLLFFLLMISLSCEIEYDGETKIVLKGKITNQNNESIANQTIKLYVTRDATYVPFLFYYPSETNLIGIAKTNNLGNFTIVIPKPTSNYNEIILDINEDSNDFNSKKIVNIKTTDFNSYELNLNTTKLYYKADLCRLKITPNNVNPGNELLSINIEGEVANEISYFNLPEEYGYYYETQKNVLKNQTIQLVYKYKNYGTNTIISNQVSIPIDNSNMIEYTFNY